MKIWPQRARKPSFSGALLAALALIFPQAQLNSPLNAWSFGISVAVVPNAIAVSAPFAPILESYGQI